MIFLPAAETRTIVSSFANYSIAINTLIRLKGQQFSAVTVSLKSIFYFTVFFLKIQKPNIWTIWGIFKSFFVIKLKFISTALRLISLRIHIIRAVIFYIYLLRAYVTGGGVFLKR